MPVGLNTRRVIRRDSMNRARFFRELYLQLALAPTKSVRLADLVVAGVGAAILNELDEAISLALGSLRAAVIVTGGLG